jgi:AcrR family transcriptional regulator
MASSIASLIIRGMAGGEGKPGDRNAERILDAAMTEIALSGVTKLTIEGVARRAGVNRATLYRRFGDLDKVIEALTMREGRRMADAGAHAIEGVTDPAERLVEAFVASIRMAREHPIISRTASLEPGQLIAAGLADNAALLKLGSGFAAAAIRTAQSDGYATHLDADEVGQTIAILFAACVLLPTTHGSICEPTTRYAPTRAARSHPWSSDHPAECRTRPR